MSRLHSFSDDDRVLSGEREPAYPLDVLTEPSGIHSPREPGTEAPSGAAVPDGSANACVLCHTALDGDVVPFGLFRAHAGCSADWSHEQDDYIDALEGQEG